MIQKIISTKVHIDSIVVLSRRRRPIEQQIGVLRKSLRDNGLLSPISVRIPERLEVEGRVLDGRPILVFGATRLAAAKAEGWEEIQAEIVTGTEFDFQKAELAENLHRAEINEIDRAGEIAAYEELLRSEARKLQDAVKLKAESGGEQFAATRREKVGHRRKGAVDPTSRRTAAKELGLSEKALRRASKIASLSPEAKEAAGEAGIANKQTALLEVAKETTPERQVAKVHQLSERKRKPSGTANGNLPPSIPAVESQTGDRKVDGAEAITAAWHRATHEEQRRAYRELRDEFRQIELTTGQPPKSIPEPKEVLQTGPAPSPYQDGIPDFPSFLDRRRKPAITAPASPASSPAGGTTDCTQQADLVGEPS